MWLLQPQNQALNALVFLYRHVVKQPLAMTINAERATRKVKVPVVLSRDETKRIINAMSGIHQLVVKILYGSGLRIIECLRLRVQDIDFEIKALTVRSGKGDKDRITTFPPSLRVPMEAHLEQVKIIHEADIANGYGEVFLPHALARKYPNAARQWRWQYVFPGPTVYQGIHALGPSAAITLTQAL